MRVKRSSLTVSGGGAEASCSEPAIRPSSVWVPVATTAAWQRPRCSVEPANSMVARSASGVSGASTPPAAFSTGSDSPVSADSSAWSSDAERRRRSAGTRPPASRITTSPGTSALLSVRRTAPCRQTRQTVVIAVRNAAVLASARDSCAAPMAVLMARTMKMKTAWSISARTSDTAAAASSR